MSIDPDLFRSILGRFASGITVVTTRDEHGSDHGMTVSAFSSVSLDPPLVLVCVANDATMAPAMSTASSFGVSILSDTEEPQSRRFSGKTDDRFADLQYTRGSLGNALLSDALATIDCRITARYPAGDHVIVVGEVDSGGARDARPLLYYRGGYAQLER